MHEIRGTNFWDTLYIYIFNKFAKNLFKIYRYFCFILLFTCSSPCRKEQLLFYDFLQVIVLNQVYNWAIRHHSKVCRCRLADILYFGQNTEHWVAYGCLEHSCILPLNSPFICSSKISQGCSTRYALS